MPFFTQNESPCPAVLFSSLPFLPAESTTDTCLSEGLLGESFLSTMVSSAQFTKIALAASASVITRSSEIFAPVALFAQFLSTYFSFGVTFTFAATSENLIFLSLRTQYSVVGLAASLLVTVPFASFARRVTRTCLVLIILEMLIESVLNEIMDSQTQEICKRNKTVRNGYRQRRLITTAGNITLRVPRLRQGNFSHKASLRATAK